MAETLRLCPFCGGEAKFETYGGTACAVVCQSCRCGTPTMSLDDGMQAVEAWNRRAERTCHIERVSTPYHAGPPRCSACMMPLEPLANFCSYCGARVVSE